MSSRNIRAIRRFSAVMVWVIPVIGAFSILLPVLFWIADINVIWFGDNNNLVIADNSPIDERRLTGIAAIMPALIVWLVSLYHLFLLFQRFRRGTVFDLTSVMHLRAYALFVGLTALFTVAGSGARRWALGEFSDAPLWTHIQISPEHWLLIFTAAIFYFVAFVIEEAKAYKDEAENYV